MQPQDPSAQDLLGKLYFKLGVYPRAIELYQDIVRQFPDSLPPRINLALAYLKTAQLREAITQLLPVIERDPTHARAWGYLGLCWSRLNEFAKAREAFLRAGHHAMAQRMDQALEAQYGTGSTPFAAAPSGASTAEVQKLSDPDEIDTSVLDPGVVRVASDTTTSPGRWTMRAPGESLSTGAAAPLTIAAWSSAQAFAPAGRSVEAVDEMVVAHEGSAIRATADAFGVGWVRGPSLRRRSGEPFDGESPLLWVAAGWCAVPKRVGHWTAVLTLRDEGLVVRERAVLALDGALHIEPVGVQGSGLNAVSIVGRGVLALGGPGTLRIIHCVEQTPVLCDVAHLVAFSPAIVASLEGPLVRLQGEGIVAVAHDEVSAGATK